MKSIHKVLDILEIFSSIDGDEIRLSELSKLSGVNKSTVNRVVSVLVDRGYLSQKEKWGKYSIGEKLLSFSGTVKRRLKIREVAMPYLVKLSNSTKEAAILAIWSNKTDFYHEIIEPYNPLKIIPDESTVMPLYCTGVGKIILAHKTEQELEQYFRDVNLVAVTEKTITDISLLKKQLKKIAKENIAYDDEECLLGAVNVASGIKDADGKIIACSGVFGPSARLTRVRIAEIAPQVKSCAMQISRALGVYLR